MSHSEEELREWAAAQQADPCARRGHTCRCPHPDADQWHREWLADREAALDKFRRLFRAPDNGA